jgi:hypothetical protein
VFVRNGTTWTQQQHLTAADETAGAHFGVGVAISGNTVLAGAPRADVGASNLFAAQANDQGAVYVFVPRVFVGGRILAADGISGVANAIVQMTSGSGATRTTLSSSLGYYSFEEVEADQTVTISVSSKRYQFTPRMVQVTGNLTDVDLVAQP